MFAPSLPLERASRETCVGSKPMSLSPSLVVHAVGGTEEMRKERCGFLADVGGPRCSYYKADTTYGDPPLNPWHIPHHVKSEKVATIAPPAQALQDGDVLVCIGHVQRAEMLATLRSVKLSAFVGQGPGFNYSPETANAVDTHVGSAYTIHCDEGKCPAYDMAQWSLLMESYPAKLRAMRGKQIGSFLWTRQERFTHADRACGHLTSAFYNQWGANDCTNPKKAIDGHPSFWVLVVERAILERAEKSLGALDVGQAIRRLSSTAAVSDTFVQIYTAYRTALAALPEESRSCVYDAFAAAALAVLGNLNAVCQDAARDLLEAPAVALLHGSDKIPRAGGIKEYDAYAAHCALRRMAGMTAPKYKHHYDFLLACVRVGELRRLNPGLDIRYPPAMHLREAARRHIKGRVHVWHDLGFDPQNDDWLALQLLQTVLE